MKKPELLAPAAGFDTLAAAVEAGADSVYFGVTGFNMRANARNFSVKDLKKIAGYCRKNGVKAYLAINTIVYEDEIKNVSKILKEAKKAKIDAIILWDMAVLEEAKKLGLDIHLSTQASVSNSKAAEHYRKKGVSRIILARECRLEQIKKIKKSAKAEIEAFVHGAMCVSVSGRCLISEELFRKSANRGDCIQPCRREYILTDVEEKHKLRIGRKYIISPKDLCALPFIEKLIKAGIDAFKIEGRNRSPEYVKKAVSVYRTAIDAYFEKTLSKKMKDTLMDELREVYNRGFSSGFFLGEPKESDFTDSYGSKAKTRKSYIGYVANFYRKVSAAEIKIEAGSIKTGDRIIIIGNKTGVKEETVSSIEKKGKKISKANKGERAAVKTKNLLRENDKVYAIRTRK